MQHQTRSVSAEVCFYEVAGRGRSAEGDGRVHRPGRWRHRRSDRHPQENSDPCAGRVFTDLAVAVADGADAISGIEVLGDREDLFGPVACPLDTLILNADALTADSRANGQPTLVVHRHPWEGHYAGRGVRALP